MHLISYLQAVRAFTSLFTSHLDLKIPITTPPNPIEIPPMRIPILTKPPRITPKIHIPAIHTHIPRGNGHIVATPDKVLRTHMPIPQRQRRQFRDRIVRVRHPEIAPLALSALPTDIITHLRHPDPRRPIRVQLRLRPAISDLGRCDRGDGAAEGVPRHDDFGVWVGRFEGGEGGEDGGFGFLPGLVEAFVYSAVGADGGGGHGGEVEVGDVVSD